MSEMKTFEDVKQDWESHDDWFMAERSAEQRYFFETGQRSRDESMSADGVGKLIRDAAVKQTALRCIELGKLYGEKCFTEESLLLSAIKEEFKLD